MAAKEANPSEFHHTYEESVYTRDFPEQRVYDDTFDRLEKAAWGGRPWVSTAGGQQRDAEPILAKENGFTILSYNTFADCKCQNVRYSTAKKWKERSRNLINEIVSYNADIICLQDVDHFGDWWRPQLMIAGYDSVYKKRTHKRSAHYEGVLIAYKRNSFQLFRSVQLELNKTRSLNTNAMGSSFKERLVTDDVALICMLQPWKMPPEKKAEQVFSDKFSKMKPVKNKFAKLRAKLVASGKYTVPVVKEGLSSAIIDNDQDDESAPAIVVSKGSNESKQDGSGAGKLDPLEDFSAFDEEASESEEEADVGEESEDEPDFDHGVQSAICVVSAQLSSREQDADVRYYQAQYIMKEVENANKEFQLPVVLGVCLNDSPISSAYHVFKTGRSPIKPQAPRKCNPPRGVPICRGSTRVCWKAPLVTKEDPPILTYKIAWRPGGSLTLGFRLQIEVDPVACLAYGESTDALGIKRTYQLDELQFVIPGLTSDIPFEFIVCAVNEIGEGIWSDPSMPVVMPNPERAPPMPALKVFRDTKAVRQLREGGNMRLEDWDVEVAISSNPLNPRTQMTPRLVDGRKDREVAAVRILPMSLNPREGWKKNLGGGFNEDLVTSLMEPRILNASILRRREEETNPGTFLPAITDSPRGKRALIPGMSTKHFLLQQDPQNDFAVDLFDPNLSLDSSATELSSVNFVGTFSQRRYDKTLAALVAREKILRTGELESSIADLERSQMVATNDSDDEFGDGLDEALPAEESKRAAVVGPGGTGSQPFVETETRPHNDPDDIDEGGGDHSPGKGAGAEADEGRRINSSSMGHGTQLALLANKGKRSDAGSPAGNTEAKSFADSQDELSVSMQGGSVYTTTTMKEKNFAIANAAWEQAIKAEEMAKLEDMRIANLEGLRDISRVTSKLNDATYLDGTDLFKHIGLPHPRHLHNLPMRSAYELYASGGEPLYTQSYPAEDGICGVQCTDFLFYSGASMYATHVLAIPEISQLRGENPREILAAADPMFLEPKPPFRKSFNREKRFVPKDGYGVKPASNAVVQAAKKDLLAFLKDSYNAFENENIQTPDKPSAYWAGIWAPLVTRNEQRNMHWLPNDLFSSSHIALAAKISFVEGNLTANWR
jgi:hypothetical protein